MAYGDAVKFTNTEFASTFAEVLNRNLVPMFGKISPFWAKVFSELPDQMEHIPFGYEGKMLRDSSGGSLRLQWQGTEVPVTAVTNPFAAAAPTAGPDNKATDVQLTRLHVNHSIDAIHLKYITGKNSTVNGFVDREAERVIRSFYVDVSTRFHGTGDQTQGTLGSWRRALAADDALGTYCGIQRAAVGNTPFHSQVITPAAALTVARLEDGINRVIEQGGTPDLILMGRANYNAIKNELRGGDRTQSGSEFAKYGARFVSMDGIAIALDGYCPATEVAVLDTSTWAVAFDGDGFGMGEVPMVRDQTRMQAMSMMFDLQTAVVCENPRFNCKILTT